EQLCKSHKSLMKKLPDWLFGETDDWVDSGLVGQLMMANDDPHGSEEGTRADIVELFAEVGVDVEVREG
ncbi:MAG: hypothetical protein Q8R07_02185, partial [Candidatus Uhrbacteria bacterium]|nr:hypothetical protein [Candidatus Uhrbacteria bacterium]